MAYENFIPRVWSKTIERELERLYVFAVDCNRKYEGEVKKRGDSVRILGVGKPTITKTNDKDIKLEDAENIDDTSVTMPIKKIAYFNYKVGDIDKAQSSPNGLMDALSMETSEGLSDVMDKDIAALAEATAAKKLFDSDSQVTAENVLQIMDKALETLYGQDVKPQSKIVFTVSPRFYTLFKQAYIKADTNNSEILKNGMVAKYGNAIVRMSNNVAKSKDGTTDFIMCRTDRAIAFCNPMTHVEPYRPEKGFEDAVKGFVLYDCMVVRPKELCVLNVKY